MKHFDRVILGGGPTGICLGAILGIPIITDAIHIPRGPVYLYETPETVKFLGSLGISTAISRKISIGYFFRNKLTDVPPEMALFEYTLKTKKEKLYAPKTFDYLDVGWDVIFEAAQQRCGEIFFDQASSIDFHNRFVHTVSGNGYHYDHLISTVPAPMFKWLTGNVLLWSLHYIPVFTTKWDVPTCDVVIERSEWMKYDYVYFCDFDDKRIRWTRDGTIEIIPPRNFKSPSLGYRIIDGEISPVANVTFAGRFARWEEERLISDDIKQTYNAEYYKDVLNYVG